MAYRNLPINEVFKFKDLIEVKDSQILSMGIGSHNISEFRIFSFSKDEEVKQEIYPLDTLYLCLEGELLIEEENKIILSKDEAIIVPRSIAHKIIALKDTKLLEIKTGD